MPKARYRTPASLNDLLYSEWEEVIEQANLGEEDGFIARRCLLDGIPQIDIAEEMGDRFAKSYNRSTLSRRMVHIIAKIERTARKLGKIT
jgi:hypothetical protein